MASKKSYSAFLQRLSKLSVSYNFDFCTDCSNKSYYKVVVRYKETFSSSLVRDLSILVEKFSYGMLFEKAREGYIFLDIYSL